MFFLLSPATCSGLLVSGAPAEGAFPMLGRAQRRMTRVEGAPYLMAQEGAEGEGGRERTLQVMTFSVWRLGDGAGVHTGRAVSLGER